MKRDRGGNEDIRLQRQKEHLRRPTREARVVRRLRQEDLAARIQLKGINMERDSISRIEIGTRFVSDFELKIFAEVLGVSVQWLLGIDE